MLQCWSTSPAERPSFTELKNSFIDTDTVSRKYFKLAFSTQKCDYQFVALPSSCSHMKFVLKLCPYLRVFLLYFGTGGQGVLGYFPGVGRTFAHREILKSFPEIRFIL